jgi:hypothetical protein
MLLINNYIIIERFINKVFLYILMKTQKEQTKELIEEYEKGFNDGADSEQEHIKKIVEIIEKSAKAQALSEVMKIIDEYASNMLNEHKEDCFYGDDIFHHMQKLKDKTAQEIK